MTEIEFQVEIERRRPQTLIGDPAPSVLLSDEYEYPFIIASVPTRGPRGYQGETGETGPLPTPFTEILDGVQDNATVLYDLTYQPSPGSTRVSRNGLLEVEGIGYTLAAATITFTTPPLATDLITVTYYIQP